MSEQEPLAVPDPLESLKAKADKMGIKYHPSIGLDALRNKINEKLAGNEESTEEVVSEAPKVAAPAVDPDAPKLTPEVIAEKKENVILTPAEKRLQAKAEATRLVRVRLSCMNPNKKAWEGEIITVSNGLVGSMKKYIPFNNEEGWHIPYMMFLHLKDRECQIFVQKRNGRGQKVMQPKLIKEFAIELLPDLTEGELKDLAQRQAVAGSLD